MSTFTLLNSGKVLRFGCREHQSDYLTHWQSACRFQSSTLQMQTPGSSETLVTSHQLLLLLLLLLLFVGWD
jgi:hypothetical protein